MTPRELAIARDLIARTRLQAETPKPPRKRRREVSPEKEAAGNAALAALHEAERRATERQKPNRRYPVVGQRSFIECPVHELVVSLGDAGRIISTCPACVREAALALETLEETA